MPHRIDFVIFPGFQLLDAAGPLAAFEVAEAYRPGSYRWRIVAPQAGPVAASAGVAWQARGLPRAGSFDTLMLAGGDGVDAVIAQPRLLRWLRRAVAGDVRVASVCSGSLWLAAAGLLDERRATTHWCRTPQFTREYPQVRLQPERIFVQDGRFWTSAGISAGIDLALALVAHDHGETLARQVAQHLVVYYRRPGGQSQFSQMLALQHGPGRFAALLDDVRSRLQERHGVAELAERACMSPRHFARAFTAETGSTPARAVERLRAEAARTALASGTGSVQQVAKQCGYANPETMRRSFLRLYGLPPSAVRRL
ncbi:MAG: GlxA family transcriptional regulator [Burkholderiaceae bacterium]